MGRVIDSDDPGKEISQTCKPERHRRGRLREIDHPVWENGEAVKAVPLRFVEQRIGGNMFKSYVGVDLHRNNFTYCIRNANGKEVGLGKCSIRELNGFADLMGPHAAIAVEATGNTFMFCNELKDKVGRLVVVNPSQFKVISKSTKKTDKNDARILAEFLEKDMLPEVRMKDALQAKISSLTKTREKLVQLRTVLKNKINNLLASRFIEIKREELSSEKGLQKALSHHIDDISDIEMEVLVEQIRGLNKSIEKLDKAIEEHGSKMDGFKNLKSIKGIGAKGAAVMLSAIGNIGDFRSAKHLASYLGMVPSVSNSNEKEHYGRITKQGNKTARTAMVQCALIAMRYNAYLRHFHQSVKSRRGGAKANIALARKFLDIVYKTLKNDWVFEDFTQFKLVKN